MRGTLPWQPYGPDTEHLVAEPVRALASSLPGLEVAEIDPELADTAALCEAHDTPEDHAANCVVVAGRRGDRIRYAAAIVLATTRADVNGVIRKHLDARKASFAPMEDAVRLTGMEYGGITPVGLPEDWSILVDEQVLAAGDVVIGAGLRRAKLLLPASSLLELPGARPMTITR